MSRRELRVPRGDFKTHDLIREYGGWETVLHPSFEPSNDFCNRLVAAGFSVERLNSLRENSFEIWLFDLAGRMHQRWRMDHKRGHADIFGKPSEEIKPCPLTGTAKWTDDPRNSDWDGDIAQTMELYGISKEQIEATILANPDQFPPVPYELLPPEKPPPTDPALVPKRPHPSPGGIEIALPLPDPPEDAET